MRLLFRTCHSLILIYLTRLLVQEREIAQMLGPLDLVALLFGLGTDCWFSVSCCPSDGSAGRTLLIVELGVVPGTMGPGCCSQHIVGSLGSAPRAKRADPFLGSSLGGS